MATTQNPTAPPALPQKNYTQLPPPGINDIFQKSVVFGVPVSRTNAVGADLQGKYMGDGTFVNAGRNFFTTKENVLMSPSWAGIFNDILDRLYKGLVERAIDAGNTSYSAGIYGVLSSTGTAGYYVPGITRYYPDDRARISISGMRDPSGALDPTITPYALPGSTMSMEINQRGYAVGLASVRNPQNTTGYLRVGSKGWRDALARYALGTLPSTEIDMQHLFGQGAAYGLGPIYNAFNINIIPTQQGNNPVRYRLPDNITIKSIVNDSSLMRAIQVYYDQFLKSSDQQRLGKYGSASLLLRHANLMQTASGRGDTNPEQFHRDVVEAFNNNGSVAGVAKWTQGIDGVDYADFNNRRGLTANPLRTADGVAIPASQAMYKNAGECNIYGSGPGVSQRASFGGEYGLRFYKGSKKHYSTRKGDQGVKLSNDTYYCAPTPDYTVNPDRKIYQTGGARATPTQSLEQVLATYGVEGFDAQDLRQRYSNWTASPEKFGTNPYFMLNPATNRRGFLRAAPKYRRAEMTQQQAAEFAAIQSLSQATKLQRSDDLAREFAGNYTPTSTRTSNVVSGRDWRNAVGQLQTQGPPQRPLPPTPPRQTQIQT